MSDSTIHVAAVPDERASATLPPYGGASALISMALWEADYQVQARPWTTDKGQDVVSLAIGSFQLTLTPEQWAAVTSLVARVIAEGMAA